MTCGHFPWVIIWESVSTSCSDMRDVSMSCSVILVEKQTRLKFLFHRKKCQDLWFVMNPWVCRWMSMYFFFFSWWKNVWNTVQSHTWRHENQDHIIIDDDFLLSCLVWEGEETHEKEWTRKCMNGNDCYSKIRADGKSDSWRTQKFPFIFSWKKWRK